MNIQRYALPMIITAGFHGALFLMTPDLSVAHDKTVDKPPHLRPMPDEEKIVEMVDPSETSSEPSGGGPVLPVISEVVVALPDKAVFTMPKTDNPLPDRLVTSDIRSISTPGDGTDGPKIPGRKVVWDSRSLDRHPRATAQMSPDYPASLHQQGISGSVTVEFDVDTAGRVIRAEAVNYSRREFVDPALRAVRSWRFEPGKRNGKVVPFRMAVPIQFSIDA